MLPIVSRPRPRVALYSFGRNRKYGASRFLLRFAPSPFVAGKCASLSVPLCEIAGACYSDTNAMLADAGSPSSVESETVMTKTAGADPASVSGRNDDWSVSEAPATVTVEVPGQTSAPAESASPGGNDKAPDSAESRNRTRRRRGYRRRGRNLRSKGPFYAALDLGTNNCRLLVAEPHADSFRVVDSFSRIVRLGEGLTQSGRLSDAAMARALNALRICRNKIGDRNVKAMRLIATEACRQAANGQYFLDRVKREIGLDLEVIDRRTEARLAVAGCHGLLDPQAAGAVLFDIGGGSSEIVWLDRKKNHRRRGLLRAWVSLPVGVVTLSERHGGVEIDEAVFNAMVDDVQEEFHRFKAREALKDALAERYFHFLGTSGTVTTLAGVHLELPRYDRRRVDGLWMEDQDIERMMGRITAMHYDERVANPCIGRERADLVLAGCAIFEAIRREWPCNRLRVADRGLREGILVQLMRSDGHLRSNTGGNSEVGSGGGAP